MKISTLNDLKIFLNECNEWQLSQEALLYLVDKEAEPILTAMITEEDEYLTDEGYMAISSFEPEDDLDFIENYDIRPAGHVYLLNE